VIAPNATAIATLISIKAVFTKRFVITNKRRVMPAVVCRRP